MGFTNSAWHNPSLGVIQTSFSQMVVRHTFSVLACVLLDSWLSTLFRCVSMGNESICDAAI